MRKYKVETAAVLFPVTLSDVKDELNVEHSRRDDYITTLYKRATAYLETLLERPIMEQTVKIRVKGGVSNVVLLPSPVVSISSISGIDIDKSSYTETSTALTVGDYTLRDTSFPVELFGDFTATYDAYEITLVCGYQATADVPDTIKELVYLLVNGRYHDRLNFADINIRRLAVNERHNNTLYL